MAAAGEELMPRKRRRVADGDAPAAERSERSARELRRGTAAQAGCGMPGCRLRARERCVVPCGRGLADHSRKLPLWKKGRGTASQTSLS